VLKADGARWFIHYDGFGDNWDSWFEGDKIRARSGGGGPGATPAPEAATPPVTGDPVVGEVAEASWNDSWYEIDVLKVEDGRYFVHWRGYGSDQDQWLTRDRIRRKGEEKEVLPRRGREGDGGGLVPQEMVGRDVEVFWHGRWWPSTVVATDGTRLRIRYKPGTANVGGLQEEWAVKERVRAPGAAARVRVDPAKVPGAKGLSGLWYVYLQVGTSGVARDHYLFFEDGRVYHAMPPGAIEDFDFAAAQASDPDHCGGYGVEAGHIRFEYGGDADEVAPKTLEPVGEGHFKMNGLHLRRAPRFPDDARLDATYRADRGGSTYVLAQSVAMTFRRDGTFEEVVTLTGSDPGESHGVRERRTTGRYRLRGWTLEVTGEAGTTRGTCYPGWEPGEAEDRIVWQGVELRLVR
jgi:hypothetical protein